MNSLSTIESHAVDKWIDENIAAHNYTRLAHIHITDLIPHLTKDKWIEMSVAMFIRAVEHIRLINVSFLVDLSIRLRSEAVPLGVNFKSIEELTRELTYEPPALYLLSPTHPIRGHSVPFEDSNNLFSCPWATPYLYERPDDDEAGAYVRFLALRWGPGVPGFSV